MEGSAGTKEGFVSSLKGGGGFRGRKGSGPQARELFFNMGLHSSRGSLRFGWRGRGLGGLLGLEREWKQNLMKNHPVAV